MRGLKDKISNSLLNILCINVFFLLPGIVFGVNMSETDTYAVDDDYSLAMGCNNDSVAGNLLLNDVIAEGDSVIVSILTAPEVGNLICDALGNFMFQAEDTLRGEVQFSYQLTIYSDSVLYSNANVTIFIDDDNDCDNVADYIDIDDDNDGILDYHESLEGQDFDGDGIPNSFDIDSDNDGITDFDEWQVEDSQLKLSGNDINLDGWDDAFDASLGGEYYEQVDTDLDGSPDYLDTDSDGDDVADSIEANDIDNDEIANCFLRNSDLDQDGLDDNFDNVFGWDNRTNPMGSNSVLPDYNENGIRDWRDVTNYSVPGTELQVETPEKELFVYPNPAQYECTVIIPEDGVLDGGTNFYKLYTLDGKLILHEKAEPLQFVLDISGLTDGKYILIVYNNSGYYNSFIQKIK